MTKKQKGLEAWFKWYNSCLARLRTQVQIPVQKNKKRKNGLGYLGASKLWLVLGEMCFFFFLMSGYPGIWG
jgi:hypothetical protein